MMLRKVGIAILWVLGVIATIVMLIPMVIICVLFIIYEKLVPFKNVDQNSPVNPKD
jgi:hypothetical protein